jgi:hypothetical protein
VKLSLAFLFCLRRGLCSKHKNRYEQSFDPDPEARASIDAWVKALGLSNVRRSIDLDAAAADWPIEKADAVICINMIHIAPWKAAVGLVGGAARVLDLRGLLMLYGPFREGGQHTAPSNGDPRARHALVY